MIKGIIYLYISPSCKCYIGQTIDEIGRRRSFLNINQSYGGKTINKARKKYLPENFSYEVLFESWFETKDEAKDVLNELELYYINLYDSYKNGYNETVGGSSKAGYITSEETKLKISESQKGEKGNMWGKNHSEETKQKMSESHLGISAIWLKDKKPVNIKPVAQYSLDDTLINVYISATDAAIELSLSNSLISAVCRGTRNKTGGFRWKYINKEEYDYWKRLL